MNQHHGYEGSINRGEAKSGAARRRAMKVLIADDSSELRERVKMLLAEVKAVDMIREAENVRQAIECVRESAADVIILDMRMPDGTGLDVLQAIEKRDRAPIVIVLTSFPYPQYRRKCMDAGADFFFDKSTEMEKVIEVLAARG